MTPTHTSTTLSEQSTSYQVHEDLFSAETQKKTSQETKNQAIEHFVATLKAQSESCSAKPVRLKQQPSKHFAKYMTEEECLDFLPANAPCKIAHNDNPHSCYVAVMLNTFRYEIFTPLFEVTEYEHFKPLFDFSENEEEENVKKLKRAITFCLDKMRNHVSSSGSDKISNEVCLEDIIRVQKALRMCGIITNAYADPMEVLGNVLDKVAPHFFLCQMRDLTFYELGEEEFTDEQIKASKGIIGENIEATHTDIPEITIQLGIAHKSESLAQAFERSKLNVRNQATNHYRRKENRQGQSQNYLNIKKGIRREFLVAPQLLIFQLNGSYSNQNGLFPIEFSERFSLTSLDGTEHFYTLCQVNCHSDSHEYAYLKHQGQWFLSDDMKPIRKADFQQGSRDVKEMCKFGRTFIYTKISSVEYRDCSQEIYSDSMNARCIGTAAKVTREAKKIIVGSVNQKKKEVPQAVDVAEGIAEENHYSDTQLKVGSLEYIVDQQLEGLIKLCESLLVSKSLDDLVKFSWGIACLPKEKKFTEWPKVMTDRQWLLLEDIARQIYQRFENWPDLTEKEILLGKELVEELIKEIAAVKFTLESLRKYRGGLKKEQVPQAFLSVDAFKEIGKQFSEDFDSFVLQPVISYLGVLREARGTTPPVQWLTVVDHVKVVFRTIEVIGEASKILSEETKILLPTLILGDLSEKRKDFWKMVRDNLHHCKQRSWQIVECYPEIFAYLLEEVFPQLDGEIESRQSKKPPLREFGKTVKALKMICKLCNEYQFIRVGNLWKIIGMEDSLIEGHRLPLKKKFLHLELKETPNDFEREVPQDFETIWKKEFEPHLKPGAKTKDVEKDLRLLFGVGRGYLISDEDIEELKIPVNQFKDKNDIREELRKLLRSICETHDDSSNLKFAESYKKTVNQLVFLKGIQGQDECDGEKYAALIKLADQRLKMVERRTKKRVVRSTLPTKELVNYVQLRLKKLQSFHVKGTNRKIHEINLEDLLKQLETLKGQIQSGGDLGSELIKELFAFIMRDEVKDRFSDSLAELRKKIDCYKKSMTAFSESEESKTSMLGAINPLLKFFSKSNDKKHLFSPPINEDFEKIEKKLIRLKGLISSNQYSKSSKSSDSDSKLIVGESLEQLSQQKVFVGLLEISEEMVIDRIDNYRKKLKELNETEESKNECVQSIEVLSLLIKDIVVKKGNLSWALKEKFARVIDLKTDFIENLRSDNCKARDCVRKIEKLFTKYFYHEEGDWKEYLEEVVLDLNSQLDRACDDNEPPCLQDLDEILDSAKDVLAKDYILGAITAVLAYSEVNESPNNEAEMTSSPAQTPNTTKPRMPSLKAAEQVYLRTFCSSKKTTKGEKGSLDKITGEKKWREFTTRKISRKILSEEEKNSVLGLLPKDYLNNENGRKLKRYLEGAEKVTLTNVSPYAHTRKKIEDFIEFLETKCFGEFPMLKSQRDLLITLFKKANRIDESEARADYYPKQFVEKTNALSRDLALRIDTLESNVGNSSEGRLLLHAAEYDVQDIGEIAQQITDRPPVWNLGREILSDQHLAYISLLRKMMAHYPLMLKQEVMRWNLGYLAFDTDTKLQSLHAKDASTLVAEATANIRERSKTTRSHLSLEFAKDKKFDIIDAFERLGFDPVKVEVLYPTPQTQIHEYLQPLGDFVLMGHPSSEMTDREYVNALMNLELVLSFELNMPVKVIGERNGRFLNTSSSRHAPESYLRLLNKQKQGLEYWLVSFEVYHIFKQQPWSYVDLIEGGKITFADHAHHGALGYFLSMIGIGLRPGDFSDFLKAEDAEEKIFKKLSELCPKGKRLFDFNNHVHFLVRLFTPPGTVRKKCVICPDEKGVFLPVVSVDTADNYLMKMPLKLEAGESTAANQPYYRNGERLDVVDGHTLLDYTRERVSVKELKYVASYTLEVLQAHKRAIRKRLNPDLLMEPKVFQRVIGIGIADPVLVQKRENLDAIPEEIEGLITEEAKELSPRISLWFENLIKNHGKDFALKLLKWLEARKKLEVVLRKYYAYHRVRIKGPLIQMDEVSKKFFDQNVDGHGYKWIEFNYRSSFSKFYDTIVSDLMEGNWVDFVNAMAIGHPVKCFTSRHDFSDRPRKFILENDILEEIKPVCKEIVNLHNQLNDAWVRQAGYTYDMAEGDINLLDYNGGKRKKGLREQFKHEIEQLAKFIENSHRLFAMIHSPQIFSLMTSQVTTQSGINMGVNEHLRDVLAEDFRAQYKSAPFLGESTSAELEVQEGMKKTVRLSDLREDLDRRFSVRKAKRDFELVDKQQEEDLTSFKRRWLEFYQSPISPNCFSNVLEQARFFLNQVLNKKYLPTVDMSDVSQNAAYWDAIEDYSQILSIEMFSNYKQSAFKMTFKHYICNEKMTFEDLLKNEELCQAFEKQPTLKTLIGSYISFLPKETRLSERHGYLKRKLEEYKQTKNDYEDYLQCQTQTNFQKREFERRLERIEKQITKMHSKFKTSVEEVKKMKFFEMLKLSASQNHFVENEIYLSQQEEEQEAFKLLLVEQVELVYQEIEEIIPKKL